MPSTSTQSRKKQRISSASKPRSVEHQLVDLDCVPDLASSSLSPLPELEDLEELGAENLEALPSTFEPDNSNVTSESSQECDGLPRPIFSCPQNQIASAIAFVQWSVPKKPTHPILTNLLIEADAATQKVKITASDLAVTATAAFDATVRSSGAIAIPADVFADTIRTAPKQSRIYISDRPYPELMARPLASLPHAHTIYIQDDSHGIAEIRAHAGEDFPNLTTLPTKPITLGARIVLSALNSVIFAATTGEETPILNAVQWIIRPSQSHLQCNATDGHRLAMSSVETGMIGKRHRSRTATSVPDLESIIPAKLIRELIKTLDRAKSEVPLRVSFNRKSKRVLFEIKEDGILKQLVGQCLDSNFPDCQDILNQFSFPHTVTINRAELIRKLERLEVHADKKVNGIVAQFDAEAQVIHLSLERDFGQISQTLSATVPGELHLSSIKLNVKYLKEAVSALLSSKLNLALDQAYTPISISSHGDIEVPDLSMSATYFIMPLFEQDKLAEIQQSSSIS